MRDRFYTDTQLPVIKLKGLQKDKTYRISGSGVDICATGETLMKAGLLLSQNYQGAGMTKDTLTVADGGTLLMTIKIKE